MDMIEWVIVAALVAAVLGFLAYMVYLYNRFQALRNAAEATLGQVKVALRKRLDMISQLADATKSYAKFERETLEKVTRMRASIAGASPEEVRDIDRESRTILGRLIAVAEAYPNLRTVEAVSTLMASIKEVESEIARHRYTFNNIVQEYNTRIDTFPSNIVANMMGARKLPYLEVGGEELEERPKIEF